MIPDAEAVANAYLAEVLDIDRIVTSTPNNLAAPWVRTTLINGPKEAKSTPAHLMIFHLQFDCYAGEGRNKRAEASNLARGLWDALEGIAGVRSGVTVNGAQLIDIKPLPDDSIEPSRERFIVEANVFMHA